LWEDLPELKLLLERKQYKQAADFLKSNITRNVEENQQNELINFLRKEMLLLNISGDHNQTTLFCEKVMKHCLNIGLDLAEYIEQCRVLNSELDWYGEQYKQVIRDLYSLDSFTALHVILAIFENLNQYLLSAKPNELEQVFYFSYVYGMETSYESGISALNRLLKLWFEGTQAGYFRGRFEGLPYVSDAFKDLRNKLAPIIRSLNFLEWLCKEVSLHHVSMENKESEVLFIINNFEEYRHFKLPFIRETARMQNAFRTFLNSEKIFNWKNEEIDYSTIVKIKESGDDFRLEIDQKSFIEAYKLSTETAYQSHLLIMEDMYINNMHELKIKNTSVTVMDLFFFYYCLKTMALIYFKATEYFIQTYKKEARAPYLVTDKKSIGETFIPLLTKVLRRKVVQSEINELIDLFSFGNNNIFDLYYKPLVVRDDKVSLIPSIFMMNNFSKTFLHHMNELEINLADRGHGFEEVIQALFTEHDFTVHPGPLPYSYEYENKRINSDIDLVAKKGKYLFLGQLKNRLEPMEPKDYRGADKKIKIGVNQAEQAELYIKRNPDEFCNRFGISREELDELIIRPFVLVSCFYGSGQVIRNIPIIDSSAVFRFFDIGEIKIFPGEDEPYSRKIRTPGEVLPEEFNEFLLKPYFLEPDIYGIQMATRHSSQIREKMFIIGSDDDWYEKYSQSFLAEAVQNFEERGLIELDIKKD
jgi:hypothetical protein